MALDALSYALGRPQFGGGLFQVGQMAGQQGMMPGYNASVKAAQEQEQNLQKGLLGLTNLAGTEAQPPDLQNAMQNLISQGATAEQASAALQTGTERLTQDRKRKGIETITKIINTSDPSNPNVQRAIKTVALNYGVPQNEVDNLLPSSAKMTRQTSTIMLNERPYEVNVTYDEQGNIVNREVIGPSGKGPSTKVDVNVGDSNKKFNEEIQKADAATVAQSEQALSTLSSIQQAKTLVQENPEVFGAGANVFDDMKRGTLQVLNVLGVGPNDPLYARMAQQTSATSLARTFTQEFVRPRMEATKGAISDREFSTFLESVPNLLQTPEGYTRVLDYMQNALNAQVMYGEFLRDAYDSGEKGAPSAVKKSWNRLSSSLPLGAFNADELRSLWGEYSTTGSLDDLRFVANNPNTGQQEIVTYKTIQEKARNRKVSVAYYVKLLKDAGQITVPQAEG